MYFEFWVMLGVNEVDVDQFRIEEVALSEMVASGGGSWRALFLESFEAIAPATYMARPSNLGGFGEFTYENYGNTSQILIADSLGKGPSRGVRLEKELVWVNLDVSGRTDPNKRYRVKFDAKATESNSDLPTASLITSYEQETAGSKVTSEIGRTVLEVKSSNWSTYELSIQPPPKLSGIKFKRLVSFFSDYNQLPTNTDTFDIDNVVLEGFE